MGVILTIYNTWDHPPSTHCTNSKSSKPSSSHTQRVWRCEFGPSKGRDLRIQTDTDPHVWYWKTGVGYCLVQNFRQKPPEEVLKWWFDCKHILFFLLFETDELILTTPEFFKNLLRFGFLGRFVGVFQSYLPTWVWCDCKPPGNIVVKWMVQPRPGKRNGTNDMGVSKNRGKTPQIIHFNRVFHYFHHPFWGTIIFGNTHSDSSDHPNLVFSWDFWCHPQSQTRGKSLNVN